MSVWEKVKKSLGVGVEAVSEKTVELSTLAKLNWEKLKIKKAIEKEFGILGENVYQLLVENKENELANVTQEIRKTIRDLEVQLDNKIKEIEAASPKGTVDKSQLKELKKDLELGNGVIEQLIIDENSPIIGKKLMDIQFPDNVLVGAIVRDEKVIIPDGHTVIQNNDKVTLLGEKAEVQEAIDLLGKFEI